MNRALSIGACGTLLLGLLVAQQPSRAEPASAPADGLVIKGSVHSIRLPDPEDEPQLPDAPGRATVQVMCAMCHTTRYIMIQPRFSREVWTAEVTKMRKTYSGPIPEEKVPEILDYLMAVRGAEAAK